MQVEQFESFALPATFPAEWMPPEGARFVRDCVAGMSRTALLRIARSRGFRPTWERLDGHGPGLYGMSLTIGRCVVPLVVRMRAIQRPASSVPDDSQKPLFPVSES
ncbi:conserved hypothetical protein (plasmid) [Paraburkholderia phytofirmans PsJN]|uniref:Uncharacterized protein n=1 Tax=Paraburkholderia phytofirmans (strain DSM 17436 / LMG 22146 / PsJN) TaxID=398527 RepID=B2THB2_PARPJ|nr:conserved hypothetical protein [Paraburkholderia phytofirmans PsJN]